MNFLILSLSPLKYFAWEAIVSAWLVEGRKMFETKSIEGSLGAIAPKTWH
jgi:hypothetical protein